MDECDSSGKWRRWTSLFVFTCVYIVGELSHFLLSIVTRPMSQEIHYGTKACLRNPDFTIPEGFPDVNCYEAEDSVDCNVTGAISYGNTSACVWDYSGIGVAFQILAGPAFIAVFTVSGIILGMVSDRMNRHVVVSLSLLLLTVATTLTGVATTFWHLVILRMAIGAGESAFAPACSSLISDLFPPAQSGLAMGIFNWGIYFGYGISYAVGNFVTDPDIGGMSWRWSYYISGILGLIVLIMLIVLVREPKRKTISNQKEVEETHNCEALSSEIERNSVSEENRNELDECLNAKKSQSISKNLLGGESGLKEVFKTFFSLPVITLTVTACVRHTAGFTWAYNTQTYFTTFFPAFNLGIWITAVSIGGGAVGVIVGGFVSDRLVKKLGLRARIYVLASSQLIATPFAVSVLFFEPPTAFYCLLGSYLFAEMWFGVMYAVLLELIPPPIQSTTVALFLFVINNVGGNAPILVEPLKEASSYHISLLVMYPGLYLLSSLLFFVSSFSVKKSNKNA